MNFVERIRGLSEGRVALWRKSGQLPAYLGEGGGTEATRSHPFGRHAVRAGGRNAAGLLGVRVGSLNPRFN